MKQQNIVTWLLEGDVAIQYQVFRDLLSTERLDLQKRIGTEGWGASFLMKRNADGHWGMKFYQPKWTSSHYTLLDLRNLCISPYMLPIRETIGLILSNDKGKDGGINPPGTVQQSDVCINGMFLNYASYFKTDITRLQSVVDFLLSQKMPDGGFNCRLNRSGAVHSSMHTTLSVLEGIAEYLNNGYSYRVDELEEAKASAEAFLLAHQLFRSDKTGAIIHKDFLRLSYPGRWKYDVLRALDYFRHAKAAWDQRMEPAIQVLLQKRNKDQAWNLQAKHPGQVHFDMETPRQPSRWNTLRALRVLRHFGIEI